MGYDALSQIDPKWHDEFRGFVTTGKASDEFLQYFEETPVCQRAAADALARLFSPFAEALHKEQETKKQSAEKTEVSATEGPSRAVCALASSVQRPSEPQNPGAVNSHADDVQVSGFDEVCYLFAQRADLEVDAIAAFVQLSSDEFQRRLGDIRNLLRSMREAGPNDRAELDTRFHVMIAEARQHEGGVMRRVCEAIFRMPLARGKHDPGWQLACDEHQVIVDALAKRQSDEAQRASKVHLSSAFSRFFPDYLEQIGRSNSAFYEKMQEGDAFLFCSLNVEPVESSERKYCGRAAADAVRRGAHLWYIFASDELLNAWREERNIHLNVTEAELQAEMEVFRRWICDHWMKEEMSHRGANSGAEQNTTLAEDITNLVNSRVNFIFLDYAPLFYATWPNHTVGYFRYQRHESALTRRLPRAEDATWNRIVRDLGGTKDQEHFLRAVHEGLMAKERVGDSVARTWLERCFNLQSLVPSFREGSSVKGH